jgi:hypothetical protein
MRALFIELPPFARYRRDYLDDDAFRRFQVLLLADPLAGDVIPGAGGLRKIRFADTRRQKGKRGGLRVIYYFWREGGQFWLFSLYDKDEAADLTAAEKRAVRILLETELAARSET